MELIYIVIEYILHNNALRSTRIITCYEFYFKQVLRCRILTNEFQNIDKEKSERLFRVYDEVKL